MKNYLLFLSLFICVFLSGCASENNDKPTLADNSINGNVEIKDEKGNVIITTDDISSASSGIDDTEPYVELVLNEKGKEVFFKVTSENIGKKLIVYVENVCVSEPVVNSAVKDGIVRILGFENEEQAIDMVSDIIEGQPENEVIAKLKKQQSPDNLVAGKIYSLYSGDNLFEFSFIVFYDDNTFRGIKPCWSYNKMTETRTDWYETTSGTYEINKAALTIRFSSEEYSGAVSDDKITFAKTVFSDSTNGNYNPDFCESLK